MWCLHDGTCLVIPVSLNDPVNHTTALDSCQSLGTEYHLLTVISHEKMVTVQNILTLLDLTNQRDFWTAAFAGLDSISGNCLLLSYTHTQSVSFLLVSLSTLNVLCWSSGMVLVGQIWKTNPITVVHIQNTSDEMNLLSS